jgi:hypothetical protein
VTLLAPGALWWLLTALPIAAVFLYRRRIIEIEVPALTLWEQTRRRDTLGRWGRRLRRWLSLLVQLLIVLALVAALCEPVDSARHTHLLVVLDDSATMQTIEQDHQSRFDLARQTVLNRLRNQPTGAPVTVILAGAPPKIALDRETVAQRARTTLSERRPRDVNPQLDAAVALAQRKRQQEVSPILVISDRYDARLAGRSDVEWLRVGTPQPNLSIKALAPTENPAAIELVLTHPTATATTATLTLTARGREPTRQTVPLRGDATVVQVEAPLTPGTPFQVTAAPLDAFPLDNTAFGVWPEPLHVRLQLVTAGNPFLEAALAQPGAALHTLAPDQWSGDQPADVTVLDAPPRAAREIRDRPRGNFIIFGGHDPFARTSSGPPAAELTPSRWSADSPLVRDVDLLRWHVIRTAGLHPPAFAERAVCAGDTPLVFVIRDPGSPDDAQDDFAAVYVNFNLNDSNITRRAGFPVFLWNAIDYLLDRRPADTLIAHATGAPLPFPSRRRSEMRVSDPTGREIAAFFDDDRLIVPFPEYAGFYRLDPAGASVVRAANYASDRVRGREAPADAAAPATLPRRPSWLARLPAWGVLAAAGGVVLVLEMLLFHRGILKVG